MKPSILLKNNIRLNNYGNRYNFVQNKHRFTFCIHKKLK